MNTQDKQELRKLAAKKLVQLHEENKGHKKRARAVQLIYKQAELGFGEIPQTHNELQEKVASLLNQDLDVLEKALELTAGQIKLGELSQDDSKLAKTADDMFAATIVGNLT